MGFSLRNIPVLGMKALQNLRGGKPFLFRLMGFPGVFGYDPKGVALIPASMMFGTRLDADVYHRGALVDRRYLGSGLVTTAGVNLLAADPSNANATLKISNNHDSGTGSTAATIADTVLQTPVVNTTTSTTVSATGSATIVVASATNIVVNQVLGIDVGGNYEAVTVTGVSGTSITAVFAKTHSGTYRVIAVRQAGAQTNPVAGQYQSVATINYFSTLAITEWGLFSDISAATTLWDHKVFAALNVNAQTSVQFQYQLTVNAGG